MTAAPHPLPSVIGRTERALTALLLTALDGSPVAGADEWVALNAVAGSTDDPAVAAAAALRISPGQARVTLDALHTKELVAADGRLTDHGGAVLAQARARIGPITHRLVDGLPEADLATAVRLLDAVRERATALA